MDPFDKHIPSVFVASSPFQILCSIAAIKQLGIDCYEVYTRMPKGGQRNDQTINILKLFGIHYHPIGNVGRIKLLFYILKALFKRNSVYKRLFICDMRSAIDYYIGCSFVSNYSSVVHLDDGGSTLTYLYNEAPNRINKRHKIILSFISKYRHLCFQKNLLTIYQCVSNPKYNIHILSLLFLNNETTNNNREIVVVGTNIDAYCKALDIPVHRYIEELKSFLSELKMHNEDKEILYIQHGRDTHLTDILPLLEEFDCKCIRPKAMVELELIARKVNPEKIYGYTSTALYTLKKIFPSSRVINIMFKQESGNIHYQNYVTISEYYVKNGIELKEYKL